MIGHDGKNILDQYLNDVLNTTGVCIVVSSGNETGDRGHYASAGRRIGEDYEDVELKACNGETRFAVASCAAPPQLYSIELNIAYQGSKQNNGINYPNREWGESVIIMTG